MSRWGRLGAGGAASLRGWGAPPAKARGLLLALVTVPALSACATVEAPATVKREPVKVEKIEGSDRSRLTLEPEAAKRIGLKTETVGVFAGSGDDTERTTVPYGAVLYDAKGTTWVYTSPQPLVFVGHPVTVDYFEGHVAVLRDGPPPGTAVVTDGGSELTGVEFGVGK